MSLRSHETFPWLKSSYRRSSFRLTLVKKNIVRIESAGKAMWRLSPHLESKPCSAQPACDTNHVTSRRCWRLQEGYLEHALISGVTFAFFSLSELRRRKLFWALFPETGPFEATSFFINHYFNVDIFISNSIQAFCSIFTFGVIYKS